ncbi:MAG: hypothetical protein HC802_05505 [Caldilineaceae bacterium]|nr:hypothetical protein [Caldilineaceae bacterium]
MLREYLQKHVTLKRIHQFDPAELQFDDALVSSCVVTYVKRLPSKSVPFEFSFGGTLDEPKQMRLVDSESLSPAKKWFYALAESQSNDKLEGIRLGDIFDVKRGIATGANGYFIVDKTIIDEYSIPDQFLKPILPSPRYIRSTALKQIWTVFQR